MGWVWFVSVESSDRGTLGWNIDRDATRDVRCPNCGRRTVKVSDD